jgi:hypothetical protein
MGGMLAESQLIEMKTSMIPMIPMNKIEIGFRLLHEIFRPLEIETRCDLRQELTFEI